MWPSAGRAERSTLRSLNYCLLRGVFGPNVKNIRIVLLRYRENVFFCTISYTIFRSILYARIKHNFEAKYNRCICVERCRRRYLQVEENAGADGRSESGFAETKHNGNSFIGTARVWRDISHTSTVCIMVRRRCTRMRTKNLLNPSPSRQCTISGCDLEQILIPWGTVKQQAWCCYFYARSEESENECIFAPQVNHSEYEALVTHYSTPPYGIPGTVSLSPILHQDLMRKTRFTTVQVLLIILVLRRTPISHPFPSERFPSESTKTKWN